MKIFKFSPSRSETKDPPGSLKDPHQQSTKVEKSKAEHINFIGNQKLSKSIHKRKSYSKFCKSKKGPFFFTKIATFP